jgi:hypothetical protein
MSTQDAKAAIAIYQQQQFVPGEDYSTSPASLVSRTQAKLETNYGERVKREERDQQSLIFANALMSAGGTFDFSNSLREKWVQTSLPA